MTTTGILLDAALKGALLLVLTTGLAAALRSASASARHVVWSAGFAGLLLLPILAVVLPWRLEILPVGGPAPAAAPFAGPRAAVGGAPVAPGELPSPGPRPSPVHSVDGATSVERSARDVGGVMLWIWGLGVVLILGRLALGLGSVWWLARRAAPLTSPAWYAPLGRVTERLGLRTPVRLARSERTRVPITCGMLRPAVVLPADADSWTDERRHAVLLHELAHVRRLDLATHLAAWVACALHWFNPLVWMAAKRLRNESERACDDLVLGAGARPSDYAGHLLDLVRQAGRSSAPALAMPFAQRSTFEGRLLAILEPGLERRAPGRARAAGLVAAVALLVVPLAAMAPVRPAAESPAQPAERSRPSTPSEELATSLTPVVIVDVENILSVAEALTGFVDPAIVDIVQEAAGAQEPKAGHDAADGTRKAEAAGALEKLLADPSTMVRAHAAQALGELEDPRSVAALSRALREDTDAEVRKMAAWALGEIESPRGVPALSEALRSDSSVEVRKTAAWALGEIEDASAVDALGAALRDASAEVRQTALWALGEIESPRAVPWLITALGDADREARKSAAWALGEIESPEAVDALGRALRDTDAEVRATALWALGEIESPQAVPWLVQALGDRSADVRGKAAWAIGEIGPESAPPALLDLTRDDVAETRKMAAWALGEISDPAAIGVLRALLNDPNDEVKQTALWALLEMDDALAQDVLLELLQDEDPEIRARAAHALGDRDE